MDNRRRYQRNTALLDVCVFDIEILDSTVTQIGLCSVCKHDFGTYC